MLLCYLKCVFTKTIASQINVAQTYRLDVLYVQLSLQSWIAAIKEILNTGAGQEEGLHLSLFTPVLIMGHKNA
jgi:hypothetical protein